MTVMSMRFVRFWHLHDSKRSSFLNSRVVSGHADGCRLLPLTSKR